MASIYSVSKTSQTRTPKTHISTGVLPSFIDPKQPPTKRSPWRQIQEVSFVKSVSVVLSSNLYSQIWPRLSASYYGTKPRPSKDQSSSKTLALVERSPVYAKVILSLIDILSSPFYNMYIRAPGSNILLLSEGIPGVDSTYTLRDGVLRLDLSREIYERVGIQGQPVKNSGGRKHTKERFVVELNLRAPSMIRGKKGFDRLVRAAKEVLNESKIWLFRDLNAKGSSAKAVKRNAVVADGDTSMGMETTMGADTTTDNNTRDVDSEAHPILQHHPTVIPIDPVESEYPDILVPLTVSQPQRNLARHHRYRPPLVEFHEDYYEALEWLDLVALASPRVRVGDNVDPYISRYTAPTPAIMYRPVPPSRSQHEQKTDGDEQGVSQGQDDQEPYDHQDLKVLTWSTGLYDSKWLTGLVIEIIKSWRSTLATTLDSNSNLTEDENAADKHDQWIAITVTAHRTEALGATNGYTIILQPSEELDDTFVSRSTRDVGADTDVTELEDQRETGGADRMDVDNEHGRENNEVVPRSGIQMFTCFQLVDA